MIGTINNPKKSFQIEKSINEVNLSIEHIPLFTKKYKLFKTNKVLNLFTFEASEALSLGVYIDINCSSINDSRTDVTIEVRRKVGSFNQSHEVTLANSHIEKITDLITESISTDEQERVLKAEKITSTSNQKEEELLRKAKEQKENNPILYYSKQVLIIAISIAMVCGTFYFLFKTFSK